jgi:putative PIN family toxin of toxin-antitoxin system
MKRPTVVVDTNLLVSATYKAYGAEAAVLDLVADHKLNAAISDRILAEYEDVLSRPHLRLNPDRAASALRLMRLEGTLVRPTVRLSVSPDESDNRFLECAEAADADYLVTGNKRHFPVRWKRTEIVNARELHARLGSQ